MHCFIPSQGGGEKRKLEREGGHVVHMGEEAVLEGAGKGEKGLKRKRDKSSGGDKVAKAAAEGKDGKVNEGTDRAAAAVAALEGILMGISVPDSKSEKKKKKMKVKVPA